MLNNKINLEKNRLNQGSSNIDILLAAYDGGSRYPGSRTGPGTFFHWAEHRYPQLLKRFNNVLNLPIVTQSSNSSLTIIEEICTEYITNKEKKYLLFGGDHSISVPSVKAFSKLHNNFKIIIFDAHHDCDDTSLLKNWSVTKYLSEHAQEILLIGVRDFNIENNIKFPNNLKIISMNDIEKLGIDSLLQLLKDFTNDKKPLYLSIDMDVLNPSEFPGVSYPCSGGLYFRELNKIMLELFKFAPPDAIDLVEFNPLVEKELSCTTLYALLESIARSWR